MNKKYKSFTLIELLVVIVIIGILAGVIMISTSSSIDKASIAKSKVFEESIQNNLAANMVSRWTLDEVIGTAAPYITPDQWGSNTGTLYGANGLPQLRPSSECVTDGCFKFDGVDDYVDLGNVGNLQHFTLNFWINPSELSIDANNNYRNIITSSVSVSFILIEQAGGVSFRIPGVTLTNFISGNIPLNQFSNVVCVYDQQYRTVYVNGLQAGRESIGSGVVQLGSLKLIYPFNSTYAFKGKLDDVRIYNAALSSSQIKQNYIAGLNSMLSNGNISNEEYNERINELAYDK
ncbi:MAG: prepilin-type N-terminal cleavage/methylation domain-containing protein [Clostridia bacterium]|nr:prepilin-type N-terminal cleavage/methylation domain-containing protein [Clostridia bacterium]